MLEFMNITRALSDENRVRILLALADHTFCVCQITALLDLSPSTTSKHLSILKQARLIEGKKDGKWVYYSLPPATRRLPVVHSALCWVQEFLNENEVIQHDKERIRQILDEEACLFGLAPGEHRDEYHSIEVHSIEALTEGSAD